MKVTQFLKGDKYEIFVTEEGKVYQKSEYFQSTGGMYKQRLWGSWRERDLDKELEKEGK